MGRPRISEDEVSLVKFRIFTRDLEALQRMSTKKNPVAKIMRTVIHSFVTHVGAEVQEEIDKVIDRDRDSERKIVPELPELSVDEIVKDIVI